MPIVIQRLINAQLIEMLHVSKLRQAFKSLDTNSTPYHLTLLRRRTKTFNEFRKKQAKPTKCAMNANKIFTPQTSHNFHYMVSEPHTHRTNVLDGIWRHNQKN